MVGLARPVTDASHYVRGFEPGVHRGIDYGWSSSQWDESHRILAALGGVVSSAYSGGGRNQGWGNRIVIDHGYGIETAYNHLSQVWVSQGQWVDTSVQIAVMGTTGDSTGDHLHFELYINGVRVDPEPYRTGTPLPGVPEGAGGGATPFNPKERRSTGVRARVSATSQSVADESKYLAAGEVGTFRGWVRGESVDGEDRWLQGEYSGRYFWLGGLEPRNVDGIPEITAVLEPFQRQVRSEAVRERALPTTDSETTREFPQGDILDFDGWTRGRSVIVDGVSSDIWFRGRYGKKWFAAACFTSQDTTGLEEVITGSTPGPVPDPSIPVPGPGLVTPTAADFPTWIRYEEKIDSEVQSSDWNAKAEAYYGEQYSPSESHTHWWGEPGKAGSHDGNVTHLNQTKELGANYVTSAGRITLTAPLDKIAFATGRRNPKGWKTENDPALTDLGYLTLGYVHYIVEKKNPHLLNEPIQLHKQYQATSCSGIDVARVRRIADAFRTGALDPATGLPPVLVPPDPQPVPDTVTVKKSWLQDIIDKLASLLK